MRKLPLILTAAAALAAPVMAGAQSDTATQDFSVIGYVPAMCFGGTLEGDDSVFDMGVLIDTSTGLLRNDLSAPDKVLSGSFCSTRSTIEIAAAPMEAQNYTATAPSGFSREVDFTATASGWTTNPAVYDTGAQANAQAVQTRSTAFTGAITVGLSDFSTSGGNELLLVADSDYLGTVTVTLTVVD